MYIVLKLLFFIYWSVFKTTNIILYKKEYCTLTLSWSVVCLILLGVIDNYIGKNTTFRHYLRIQHRWSNPYWCGSIIRHTKNVLSLVVSEVE